MPTVTKFLSLYKDKTFSQVPFCNGDIVVGSLFSYAAFEDTDIYKINKLSHHSCKISLFNKREYLDMMANNYLNPKEFKKFLFPVLNYKRYRNVRIGFIRNVFSEEHRIQYFSFTIFTRNYNVIFFRGTDETILGWKENFNLLLENKIPSQKIAKDYIEEIAKLNDRPIVIVGHSKGGNIAYYAYFNISDELKQRVDKVINLDGPGFQKDKYDYSLFGTKIFKYVPYDDFIGVIFDTSSNFYAVDTTKKGLISHDLLIWQFSKESKYKDFKSKNELTTGSKTLKIALNLWIKHHSKSELKDLVSFVVNVATCNEITDLLTLKFDIIKKRKIYLDEIANYNPVKKERLKLLSRDLVKTYFFVRLHLKDFESGKLKDVGEKGRER